MLQKETGQITHYRKKQPAKSKAKHIALQNDTHQIKAKNIISQKEKPKQRVNNKIK